MDDLAYRGTAFTGFFIIALIAWATGDRNAINRKTIGGSLCLAWGIGGIDLLVALDTKRSRMGQRYSDNNIAGIAKRIDFSIWPPRGWTGSSFAGWNTVYRFCARDAGFAFGDFLLSCGKRIVLPGSHASVC